MTKRRKRLAPGDLAEWPEALEFDREKFKDALHDQTDAALEAIESLARDYRAIQSVRNKQETPAEQARTATDVSAKCKAAITSLKSVANLQAVDAAAYAALGKVGHKLDEDVMAILPILARIAAAFDTAAITVRQKTTTKQTYAARDQLIAGVVRVLDTHARGRLTQAVKGDLVESMLETIRAPRPSVDIPRLLRRIAKQQPKIG